MPKKGEMFPPFPVVRHPSAGPIDRRHGIVLDMGGAHNPALVHE